MDILLMSEEEAVQKIKEGEYEESLQRYLKTLLPILVTK